MFKIPKSRPKTFWLLLGILTMVVSACGGAASGSPGFVEGNSEFHTPAEEPREEATEEPVPAVEEISLDGVGGNASVVAAPRRLVIMDADVNLVVSNPGQVMDLVAEMTEAYGGFVVESNLRTIQDAYNRPIPHATITVRVPANRLQQALEEIESHAIEIESKNLTGLDVTSQYTDLGSRLRNLENTAKQLTLIMDNAQNTEDTLKVYNQLTQVNDDIEVIKGKMQYYEKAAAMSSISLILNAEKLPPPEKEPEKPKVVPWEPGKVFEKALRDLKMEFQGMMDGLIRFVVYALPLLIFRLGPTALILWGGYRWARKQSFFAQPAPKSDI